MHSFDLVKCLPKREFVSLNFPNILRLGRHYIKPILKIFGKFKLKNSLLGKHLTRSKEYYMLPAVASVAGRDQKRSTQSFGKKTRDRMKVLKMRPGNSRLLGSRVLFPRATSLLLSVLASRKYLLCYDEVSLLCPW